MRGRGLGISSQLAVEGVQCIEPSKIQCLHHHWSDMVVYHSVKEVYLQVKSNMTNIIQTIIFIKNVLRTLIVLTQKNYLREKKFPHTASVLLHLTDEKKKNEGKGLPVTKKSARVRLLLGLQTPSCHA